MEFKDHFSDRAAGYAVHRPTYPDAFFARVTSLARERTLALDCGTGNGQAARGLAGNFERVVAIDASSEQIAHATRDPHIEYRVAKAEDSGLEGGSVDLVTAAQALHWFDVHAFFNEARRVMKPGAAIAVWGYGDPVLDTIPLHTTLYNFNRGTLESYWSPERKILLEGYKTVEFPFREVAFPRFVLETRWTLRELTGYVRTWSATARYIAERNHDPVEEVESALAAHWGDADQPRLVRWPLYVRAGYSGKHNG